MASATCETCGSRLEPIVPPGTNWRCDGANCRLTSITAAKARFRCIEHDFDLCLACVTKQSADLPSYEVATNVGLRLSRLVRPPTANKSSSMGPLAIKSDLLKGCVFALAGAQWFTPTICARLIIAHGGKLSTSNGDVGAASEPRELRELGEGKEIDLEALDLGVTVLPQVTHVLSSDEMASVHGNSYKSQFFPHFERQIELAEMLGIPVVSGRWLEASIRAGKLLSTASFLIFGQGGEDVNVESKLEPRVQSVVQLLFDESAQQHAMISLELDASKISLVTEAKIRQAYTILSAIEDSIALKTVKSSQAAATANLARLSSEFFSLIPHTKHASIDSDGAVKTKLSMLAALSDIVIAQAMLRDESLRSSTSISPIDINYQKLHTRLTPLEPWTAEFDIVKRCVENTRAKAHAYFDIQLQHIFEVDREGEEAKFAPFRQLKHRRLLWHGSRMANWIGILSQGLRIAPAEAPVTGYFLGKGVYFADLVSKSAEYCCPTPDKPDVLMALCEVALGRPFQIGHSKFIEKQDLDEAHYQSVMGCGELGPDPAFNKDLDDGTLIALGNEAEMGVLRSELQHNEFVVYDTAQIRVRYLVHAKVICDRDVKPRSLINAN